jgi:hypothetical protein
MADTAASVLGTPVATVDAPPSTAMIPLQDPGTSMNVDTTAAPPVATINAQPTDTIQPTAAPTYQDPEISTASVHQNWLSRILDTVGTILGGDKTIVATKHPDGTVSVEHNPSTTGEKWGRIAQAALGGAARGMAAGQGPGGGAKAFAAGTLAGLQQPAQQLAAANLEAKNMNAQQLAVANMALTHQAYLSNAEQMKERQIKFTQEQADRYNAILKSTRDAPGSEDLGSFAGVSDLPSLKAKFPDAYAAHFGQNDKVLQFDPQIDPKTMQQTGSHITLLSKPLSERMMPAGTPPLTQDYYDPVSKSIKSSPIDVSQMNRLQYSTAHQNLTKQNSDLALSVDKDLNKPPTTGPAATIAGALAPGTTRGAALTKAGETIARQEQEKAAAGRAPAPGTAEGYQAIAADLNGPNPKLDISQIRTRKDWPQIYGAARQYAIDNGLPAFDPATASAKYKARGNAINDFTNKGEADQIQSLNNFFGHAQDLMDVTQKLRNPTDMPILNTPINKLETKFGGDPRLALLKPKITVVRKEYQAFLENNRALHNEDITEGNDMMNDNMTPAQMENAVKAFSGAAITRAATTAQRAHIAGFDEIIPHILNSNSRRTIANLGLQNHLNNAWQDVGGAGTAPTGPTPAPNAQANPPAANTGQTANTQTNNAPAQRVVPAGATPGRDPATGKVIGYRTPDGTVVRF